MGCAQQEGIDDDGRKKQFWYYWDDKELLISINGITRTILPNECLKKKTRR